MATPLPKKPRLRRFRLQVELDGNNPPIQRTVWVEGDMSLGQLHHILQAAMGWTDSHLHRFTISGKTYGVPDPETDFEFSVIDERAVTVGQVLSEGLRFEYGYDFGDNWKHLLHVDQAKPLKEKQGSAFVESGKGACPPEDCGGAHAYMQFLEDLATDPKGDEVTSFLRWAGEDFDPTKFNRIAANAALLRMAWNGWGKS